MRIVLTIAALCLAGALLAWAAFPAIPGRQWVFHYQTLITGILAVGGAALAYIGIREQIDQGKAEKGQDVAREIFAARAVLPTALSALSDYAVRCSRQLLDLLPEEIMEQTVRKRLVEVPPVPDGVIGAFQNAIRFAETEVGKALADLLGALQIQHSRLRGLVQDGVRADHVITRTEIGRRVLDAVELYAGLAATFDYARRRSDRVDLNLSKEQIETALRNCGIFDDPTVDALIANWNLAGSIFRFSLGAEKGPGA